MRASGSPIGELSIFVDREQELSLILDPVRRGEGGVVLNFYGVAGIGKTRLLQEAYQEAVDSGFACCFVDLKELLNEAQGPSTALLNLLCDDLAKRPQPPSSDELSLARHEPAALVRFLLRKEGTLLLFFDSTEALQADRTFWRWAEDNVIGPLALSERTIQVFAGRSPVNWQRYEVRRAVSLHELGPLPEPSANEHITNELIRHTPATVPSQLSGLVKVLHDLSQGHPLAEEELAAYTAMKLDEALSDPVSFSAQLSQDVVARIVDDYLLQGVEAPWANVIKRACVLQQFDALLLERFLRRAAPDLAGEHNEGFFEEGIRILRNAHLVTWKAERGYHLHDLLRQIMTRHLKLSMPDLFQDAHRHAAEMYEALAEECADEEEKKRYLDEAEYHRKEMERASSEAKEV